MAKASMPFVPDVIARINRRYAVKTGWKTKYHQVKLLLGISSILPDPVEFAHAVYAWQDRKRGLVADGMLGPKTWNRMKPLTRMGAPMSPLPAWLRMDSKRIVKYNVPMISQGQSPICWLACMAMMLSYRNRTPFDIASFTGGYSPLNSSIPHDVPGVPIQTFSDQVRYMRQQGFQVVQYSPGWFSEEDLLQALSWYGPLMAYIDAARLFVHYATNSPHAVILTGLNTATDMCFINNPWGQKDERRNVDLVLHALDKWKEKMGSNAVTLMSLG